MAKTRNRRFVPGVIRNTFPSTNRPTYQQILEWDK